MATTKKTTTAKPATKKTTATKKPATAEPVVKETVTAEVFENTDDIAVEETVVKAEDVKQKTVIRPEEKKYEPGDLIMCRSVFPGTYLFSGIKTKMVYKFAAKGDTNYVEYQDLQSALLTRKPALMAPRIIIEDEELLENHHFSQLKELYAKTFALDDIEGLLELPARIFKEKFEELPIGSKKSVMLVASSMIKEGRFDSMNKINIIDEACGTNLAVMFGQN